MASNQFTTHNPAANAAAMFAQLQQGFAQLQQQMQTGATHQPGVNGWQPANNLPNGAVGSQWPAQGGQWSDGSAQWSAGDQYAGEWNSGQSQGGDAQWSGGDAQWSGGQSQGADPQWPAAKRPRMAQPSQFPMSNPPPAQFQMAQAGGNFPRPQLPAAQLPRPQLPAAQGAGIRGYMMNQSANNNPWMEKAWSFFPPMGKLGGPEWVMSMLDREPPCLTLSNLDQVSGSRVKRVKALDHVLSNQFQEINNQLLPSKDLLQVLFAKLLEDVRFPPWTVDLGWRAKKIKLPEKSRKQDDTLPPDDPQIPEDLHSLESKPEFRLLHSLAEEPAPQPPHFKNHPLRPEQLRSLAWMLKREGYNDGSNTVQEVGDIQQTVGEIEAYVVQWRQMLTCSKTSAYLDLRANASYHIYGGILGDRVGFGKTATTIGLIDTCQNYPVPTIPEPDKSNFIPAKGTLVIVPSNLLDQWAQEISKFVWDGRRLISVNSGWKAGRSDEGCPLKVVVISTVSPLKLLSAGELSEADVVLCSYRLLFSKIYQDRREDLCEGTSIGALALATRKLMRGQLEMRNSGTREIEKPTSSTLLFPMLEMFYWRRIVFDEFHELESFQGSQQSILQHMRAHSRWGLTGTPPIDNVAGVIFMSSLFRVDLPAHIPVEKVPIKKGSRQLMEVPHMQYYDDDKLMRDLAKEFLDRFARQNTAELPHIALKQSIFILQHTPAEHALYLGEAHDAPDIKGHDNLGEEKVKALERLLKLCSYFQAGSGPVGGTAEAECERASDMRNRKLTTERKTLARGVRVLHFLREHSLKAGASISDNTWRAELDKMERSLKQERRPGVEELGQEEAAAESENAVERCSVLAGHRPRDKALSQLLAKVVSGAAGVGSQRHWEAFAYMHMPASQANELLAGQVKEQAENIQSLCATVSSHEYFNKVRTALADGAAGITDLAASLKKHVTHWADKGGEEEVEVVHEDAAKTFCAKTSFNGTKYGTKLTVLVQKLQELHKQDSTAKVILFVQFDDLKKQVAAALREGHISTAQLMGSVAQRAHTIRNWQENLTADSFVLLLSLAESASGTNLTAGSHIVFLHPMLATTSERAVAQELQAIGRARRHGQKRDTLHVWRFVTDSTVEPQITSSHITTLKQFEEDAKNRVMPSEAELALEAKRARQRALRSGQKVPKLPK